MTTSIIERVKNEINQQISDKDTMGALMATTFNGLTPQLAKRALLEGMLSGFQFDDFLKKNIYAVPYGQKYSLVTSIDYVRKVAMRNGLAGKTAPEFVHDDNGEIVSCTITVKRNVDGYVGDYTATVYFNEYTTGRNLWKTKPHSMIAKVAEMHALRMAFPENLAEMYSQDEMQSEIISVTVNEEDLGEIMKFLAESDGREDLEIRFKGLEDKYKRNVKVVEYCRELVKTYESASNGTEDTRVGGSSTGEGDGDNAEEVDGEK